MTDLQRDRAASSGRDFLLAYVRMSDYAMQAAQALWPLKPKHHKFDHIIRKVSRSGYNPRHFDCYRDEDWCGHMKNLSRTTHARRGHERTLQRYCLLLGVVWQDQRCDANQNKSESLSALALRVRIRS